MKSLRLFLLAMSVLTLSVALQSFDHSPPKKVPSEQVVSKTVINPIDFQIQSVESLAMDFPDQRATLYESSPAETYTYSKVENQEHNYYNRTRLYISVYDDETKTWDLSEIKLPEEIPKA